MEFSASVMSSEAISQEIKSGQETPGVHYIFLCIGHMFHLPKSKYYIYNLEQVNYHPDFPLLGLGGKRAEFITTAFKNADTIFDYSKMNITNYPKKFKNKALYLPVPLFEGTKSKVTNIEKEYDVLFFGGLNDRRKKILKYLEKNTDMNVRIVTNVFGDALYDIIKKSRIVLNIHFKGESLLETARIHDCIRHSTPLIISEESIDKSTMAEYKNIVNFVPVIKEDLSNINELTEGIQNLLSNENISYSRWKAERKMQDMVKKRFGVFFFQFVEYFIINNNKGGGSYKWQLDVAKYLHLNTINKLSKLNYYLVNSKNPSRIKIFINSFLFTDIKIEHILNLYNRYKFKIIIPIHDWFWFSNNATLNKYSNAIHNIYLSDLFCLKKEVYDLFKICYKIICPSEFVLNVIKKHYTADNIIACKWFDYNIDNLKKDLLLPINYQGNINIGVFGETSIYKGKEQVDYLLNEFQGKKIKTKVGVLRINIIRTGIDIPRYQDSLEKFIEHIKKYNIKGLLFLNRWGETWCYTLTKALASGLPILYNNLGAFNERIPKNESKYIINNHEEHEYYNYGILSKNFTKFLIHVTSFDYYLNKSTNSLKLELLNEIKVNNIEKNEIKFNKIKKYAIYFPQFHEVKENNINFYEGYTDIINLKNLNVKNKEIPNMKILDLKNINDYDLSLNEQLISKQIELINKYNIDGFAMYYYWFSTNTITNKKRVMYDIPKRFLDTDMKGKKVFFIWANENWSDNAAFGKNNHKIINDYSDIEEHCQELIPIFKKNNYLKIDNSPVFYIHHPWYMSTEQINKFKNHMYKLCIENGFNGFDLKINAMNSLQKDILESKKNYYEFHPNYKQTKTIFKDKDQIELNYEKYVDEELNCLTDVNTIFFDFDNRARLSNPNRLDQSTICINNTNENHMKYLNKIKNSDTQILLINAWNEWGERMHIEPSEQRGDYYLDLIKNYF